MNTFKLTLIKLLPKSLISFLSTLRLLLAGDYLSQRRRLFDNEQSTKMVALFALQQQPNINSGRSIGTEINKYELRIHSQNGEDGIIFYIFSRIGSTNRQFVEFGIGDGKQCNSANLSLNFGWQGLLMEIDQEKAKAAKQYYAARFRTGKNKVKILPTGVTRENINELLVNNSIEKNLDFLSIDIDGNDYWVWEAIQSIEPRVVAIEYNASFGPEKAISVYYDPTFDRFAKHPLGYYHGASLAALTKLADKKGYQLVGCDSSGTNAFYVRKDVAGNNLREVSIKEAYFSSLTRSEKYSTLEQFSLIADMDFVEI